MMIAGIGEIAPLIEASEDSFDRQMAVNAKGAFLCATAAARQMLEQGGGGRIIINASGAGKIAPGKAVPLGVYAMSKHAAIGLTKQLGAELAGDAGEEDHRAAVAFDHPRGHGVSHLNHAHDVDLEHP